MVLAGVSLVYHTDLHIFRRGSTTTFQYLDKDLDPTVRFYAAILRPAFVLMDDNIRFYRAVLLEDYLESEEIVRMEMSTYSPDLKTIENL